MKTDEQFARIDMNTLIGRPLSEVVKGQKTLAESTADFISKVGLDGGENSPK